MSGRLAGRVAIVFGAGSVGEGWGNGKAAAVAYARVGARVVAVDREDAAAAATAGIIEAEGGEVLPVAADVTRLAEVAAAVAAAIARFGRLDILHNNVGIAAKGGPVETIDLRLSQGATSRWTASGFARRWPSFTKAPGCGARP